MHSRTIRWLVGSLVVTVAVALAGTPASASASSAFARTACEGSTTPATGTGTPDSRYDPAAIGAYKQQHNVYAAQMPRLLAQAQQLDAAKIARMGRVACDAAVPAAVTRFQIGGTVQYGQIKNWYCGPATVAEMSATTPGPSPLNLDQNAAANYMGTTQANGTTWDRFVDGLNHYVGVPDFGWNFYTFIWVHETPTSDDRAVFLNHLQTDTQTHFSPVAGSGWEVPGGPHLVGHPANQEIFHLFEIAGWDTSAGQVWYADSANTVWSSVPRYSWYSTYNMVTILGGRGYAW